jgi:hypothetical protein
MFEPQKAHQDTLEYFFIMVRRVITKTHLENSKSCYYGVQSLAESKFNILKCPDVPSVVQTFFCGLLWFSGRGLINLKLL